MKDEIKLLDPDQIRVMGTVVGSEIINRLRSDGPKSASEIAKILKRPAPGITYHLKRMHSLGLVNEVGPRGKNGVKYEAAAHRFFVDYSVPNQEDLMQATHDAARMMWKRSWDDYKAAADKNSLEILARMMFSRFEGDFTEAQQVKLWKLVKEMAEVFAATRGKHDEPTMRISMSLSVTPMFEGTSSDEDE